MARNRGIVKKGKGNATLQALRNANRTYLTKPEHVRVGSSFSSKRGSLSRDALEYCQNDVEAVLDLHGVYCNLPDLTMRLSRDVMPPLAVLVYIMPQSGTTIDPIAQGCIL